MLHGSACVQYMHSPLIHSLLGTLGTHTIRTKGPEDISFQSFTFFNYNLQAFIGKFQRLWNFGRILINSSSTAIDSKFSLQHGCIYCQDAASHSQQPGVPAYSQPGCQKGLPHGGHGLLLHHVLHCGENSYMLWNESLTVIFEWILSDWTCSLLIALMFLVLIMFHIFQKFSSKGYLCIT